MADHLHYALTEFRNTILNSVAKLEFQVRDYTPSRHEEVQSTQLSNIENALKELTRRLDVLEKHMYSSNQNYTPPTTPQMQEMATEILKIQPNSNTKNVLVSSVRSTPALAAAVAAASAMPPLELSSIVMDKEVDDVEVDTEEIVEVDTEEVVDDEEVEVEVEVNEDSEVGEVVEEEEAEKEEAEESQPELTKITIATGTYYIDDENNAYQEIDDDYVQVGIYNPKTKCVEELEEEEDEEEEEEAIEVEDFVYKGTTYQKDQENNIYLDGEHIGVWNGKRIVLLSA